MIYKDHQDKLGAKTKMQNRAPSAIEQGDSMTHTALAWHKLGLDHPGDQRHQWPLEVVTGQLRDKKEMQTHISRFTCLNLGSHFYRSLLQTSICLLWRKESRTGSQGKSLLHQAPRLAPSDLGWLPCPFCKLGPCAPLGVHCPVGTLSERQCGEGPTWRWGHL